MNAILQTRAANIEANDHAVIPCQRNGNPQPYGNEQRYPSSMVREDDTLFGVRLDEMVLLDLDGNKVPEAPHPRDLLAMLGLPNETLPIQYRMLTDSQPDGSYHWLFHLPAGVDLASLKQSVNNANGLAGVDVKTGNQLVYIKADKVLHGDTIPKLADLPEAPAILLGWITKPKHEPKVMAPMVSSAETSRYGERALTSACEAIASAPIGSRNETLNREALGVAQLVAGGEISHADAERQLLAAMFSTSRNEKMVEVLKGAERRRRRTPQEKISIVQQTFEPGMTVSHVARLHDVNANQLFKWRKQFQEGSLTAITAGEDVVPASELAAAIKQIRELQRLLGKKTMENEILKEAVEYGRAKKWIAHAPLLPGDDD